MSGGGPNPAHPSPQELLDQEARLVLPSCSVADALEAFLAAHPG